MEALRPSFISVFLSWKSPMLVYRDGQNAKFNRGSIYFYDLFTSREGAERGEIEH
jgi:hypothetical protein